MSKFEEDLEKYLKDKEFEERYARSTISVSNEELLKEEKGCKKYLNERGELVREYDSGITITG